MYLVALCWLARDQVFCLRRDVVISSCECDHASVISVPSRDGMPWMYAESNPNRSPTPYRVRWPNIHGKQERTSSSRFLRFAPCWLLSAQLPSSAVFSSQSKARTCLNRSCPNQSQSLRCGKVLLGRNPGSASTIRESWGRNESGIGGGDEVGEVRLKGREETTT